MQPRRRKCLTSPENEPSFEDVPHFADVAWPTMRNKRVHDRIGNSWHWTAVKLAKFLRQFLNEQRNIFRTFTQRRNAKDNGAEPVIQVESKLFGWNQLLKIFVCRRNE